MPSNVTGVRVNGYAIRAIRERTGLNVTQLANLVGVKQATVSNIELGKRRTTPATAKAIADALQIPILAILSDPEAA